jgi:hypothetical protein
MSREVHIFVPTAIKALMSNLGPRIEVATGVSLKQIVDLNPAISDPRARPCR